MIGGMVMVDLNKDHALHDKGFKYAVVISVVLWIIIVLILSVAYSSPYAVSDPTPQVVKSCGIQLDSNVKMDVDVEVVTGGKRCKYDLTTVSAGQHTIKATFVNIDPMWGRSESVFSAPLTFTRPVASVPVAPTGIVLTPQ